MIPISVSHSLDLIMCNSLSSRHLFFLLGVSAEEPYSNYIIFILLVCFCVTDSNHGSWWMLTYRLFACRLLMGAIFTCRLLMGRLFTCWLLMGRLFICWLLMGRLFTCGLLMGTYCWDIYMYLKGLPYCLCPGTMASTVFVFFA